MAKRAFLPIAPQALGEFLKLPADVRLIDHARFDYFNHVIELCVEGEGLPLIGDLAIPMYETVPAPAGSQVVQLVGWQGRDRRTAHKPGAE